MNNSQLQPLVSVIISCYNSSQTLRESIKSILNQSYENYEVLIMDDGSTDETNELLNMIKTEKVRLFRNKKNIGLTKSLNILISHSRGKYIARHDSDDFSLHLRLQEQVNVLENSKYNVCTSRAIRKNTNSKIPGLSFYFSYKALSKIKNPFIHGSLMISKTLLLDQGGYDEKFRYAQDYKLFTDLIKNDKPIFQIKKPLYILNMDNNISSIHSKEQNYYANCVKKNITPRELY